MKKYFLLFMILFGFSISAYAQIFVDLREYLPGKIDMPDHDFPTRISPRQENNDAYSKIFFASVNKSKNISIQIRIKFSKKSSENKKAEQKILPSGTVLVPGLPSKKTIGDSSYHSIPDNKHPYDTCIMQVYHGKFEIEIFLTRLNQKQFAPNSNLTAPDIRQAENVLSSIILKIDKHIDK